MITAQTQLAAFFGWALGTVSFMALVAFGSSFALVACMTILMLALAAFVVQS